MASRNQNGSHLLNLSFSSNTNEPPIGLTVEPPDTPTSSSSEETDLSLDNLAYRLKAVFEDKAQYKQLLECRDDRAQELLNLFQEMLDAPELDASFRRSLIVAAQRLSKKSGLYPTCYNLRGVQFTGDPVAAGSFGDIYKGSFGGRAVCIKMIRLYQTSRVEDFLTKCAKEALLWGQLSHPNVCPIFGLYRHNSRICLISSWMDHGDVTDYLTRFPQADRALLAYDAALGLSYLHENGIIHGDLKGANILVSASGRARLADFGLSSVSDANILAWTSNSSAESKGGSVRWQAPELFSIEGDEVVPNSEASDIYAWACLCYEMFTGGVPFAHIQRDAAVMRQVQAGKTPTRPHDDSPSWSAWGLTERIWSIMRDCWNTTPSLRPTVGQVINSLIYELRQDMRPADDDDTLSPARFRKEMGARLNIISVDALEKLIKITSMPGMRSKGSPVGFVPSSPASDQESLNSDPKSEVKRVTFIKGVTFDTTRASHDVEAMVPSQSLPPTGTPWPSLINFGLDGGIVLFPESGPQPASTQPVVNEMVHFHPARFMAGKDYGPILDPFLAHIVGSRPALNPIIKSTPNNEKLLVWNMLFSPKIVDRNISDQPATFPRLTSLKIISETSRWSISIQAKNVDVGVTVWDVVDELSQGLRQRTYERDFLALSARERKFISRTYHHNRSLPDLLNQIGTGMRLLDYLRASVIFGGLCEDDRVVERVVGSVTPCTYVLKCIQPDTRVP